MIPAYHRKYRAAFKCALTVVNLVCITAQLSYKFYFLSSVPVVVGSNHFQVSTDGYGLSAQYALSAPGAPASGDKILSLDKRYYSEVIFALPPQVSATARPVFHYERLFPLLSPLLYHVASICADPRGPPPVIA
jgi:hypothetical protein